MGWNWVACPHLSLRIWLAHTWLQCKIHCGNNERETGQMESVKYTSKEGKLLPGMHWKSSLYDRKCHTAKQERWRGTVWEKQRPTSNSVSTPSKPWDDFFTSNHVQSAPSFSQIHLVTQDWSQQPDDRTALGGAYLAVCGADRKPDVGGNHHGECWGQFNSEAAVERAQQIHHRRSLYQPHWHPRGAKVSPEHYLNWWIVDCWLGQMTLTEQETFV